MQNKLLLILSTILFIKNLIFSEITTLSLSNCIELAIRNNPQIKQIQEDIKIAEAQYNQAWADLYLPDLNLSGTFTLIDPQTVDSGIIKEKTNTIIIPVGNFKITNTTIIPPSTNAWFDNYSFSLGLTKPIFTGFRLLNNLSNKIINLELQKLKLKDKIKEIETTVTTSFYNLFLIKENIKLLEELDKSLLDRYNYTKENYKAGIVSEYDLVRMEVQYKNNKPKLLKAKNSFEQAKLSLCNLIGICDPGNYEFIGNLIDSTNIFINIPDENTIINKSLENDINLKSIEYTILQTKINKSIIENSRLPTLNTFLNVKLDYKKFQQTDTERTFVFSGNTGIQFNFPIDDWLPFSKTENSIIELDRTISKLEINKKQIIDNITLQVKSLLMQLDEAKENINIIQENVKQAKLGLDMANERYKYGLSSSLEVTDAEVSYNQARVNYLQTIFEYFTVEIKLKRLID